MNTGQTHTYLLYSRGLMPDDLTLGSLHLDPTNPIDSERKAWPYTEAVSPQLLRPVHFDTPYLLSARVDTQWLAGAGVLGILSGESSSSGSVDVTISGTGGRRVQLSRPEAFLNEVILESDSARRWLSAKLSVLHHMPTVARVQGWISKPPKIWMVTGLQYIKDGNVTSVSSKERSNKLQVAVPVPDPTLVTNLARIPAIDTTASRESHSNVTTTYGYEDERVWAAQFRALNVKFCRKSDKGLAEGNNGWIELQDAKSLGPRGIRGDHTADSLEQGVLGQVAGLDCEDDNIGNAASAPSLIDVMLDVNWSLLNELLELQGEEEDDQ